MKKGRLLESGLLVVGFTLVSAILVSFFLYTQRVRQVADRQLYKNDVSASAQYHMIPYQRKVIGELVENPPSPPPLVTNSCRERCGEHVCRQFEDRISAFRGCEWCYAQGKCYSKPQDSCIECSGRDKNRTCEEQFGSETRWGEYVRPVPPEQNFCKLL